MTNPPETLLNKLPYGMRDTVIAAVERASGRIAIVVGAAALTAAFIAFAGLSIKAAAFGMCALVVWALAWPSRSSASLASRFESTYAIARHAAAVWRSIIDSMPDPVIALDDGGVVLASNGLAAELFPALTAGRHLSQATRAPELLAAVESALQSGLTQQCRMDFKVPVVRSLTGTIAAVPNSAEVAGAPHLLIVLRDLTEQDRLVRMRADFVANASHELRTPLASLKGFVETLRGAAKDDPVARDKFLLIMQQQADRMARLIDDLLSLSRIEMRAHVMPRDSVDLAAVVAHVVQTLQPIARDKSITIDSPAFPPTVVSGDRDELVQVFQNLIENAIKYGRVGGRVTVARMTPPGDGTRGQGVRVSISDDGPGIAAEHLPRLTERFYRVSAAHSRNAGGTGLGLAIVKHVLNRHRADLDIESVAGAGSTFHVTFRDAIKV